ncbi:hypothetical protein [Archangium primigenium]|uniref:hypothetical protein n=1 Tax=[Archangium] primigenium TaxID=2792470 RepID=UPI00195E89C7|nr:hypothetical protein [Archangium primigenium]MBM7113304.1 hypothetical protein [Archangium primigenium]
MRFDGERLSGRLLVGVETGSITFDRRLVENVSVELKSIVDCTNGQPLAFLEVDSFPAPPEPDELLTLTPGYWYGADVRFALFDTHFTGPALPECFAGELRLRTESGHIPGRLPLRVERSVKPPPPADAAGAPAP